MSTLKISAHDAGFAVLIDETEYSYLVTSDNEPFAYFLNPAVYGTGASFVRYDATTESWVLDNVPSMQYLDDRYGVGANFLSNLYGRQPFGSSLPGVFVPLDSSSELVDVRDSLANLRLQKAFTSAVIVPYLVVKVYEERLASYEYYTYLGSPLGDGTGGTAQFGVDYTLDTETLIDTLAAELDTALSAGGALFTAYQRFTGLDIVVDYDAASRIFEVSNMARFDGHEVKGERFGEITTGHMMRPNIVIPGLTRVVGHEQYGFKPMRGAYTVFAPEKLGDLYNVVVDTIDSLTITGDSKASLVEQLGYSWMDFFRGQDQVIRLRVPDYLAPRTTLAAPFLEAATTATVVSTDGLTDSGTVFIGQELISYTGKTATTLTGITRGVDGTIDADHAAGDTVLQRYTEIRANVFLAATGAQMMTATVTIEDPENPGVFLEIANSVGINLSDTFSYADETFYNSQPTARRFITGPYGARGIVNDDGTVTWLSDGYSV